MPKLSPKLKKIRDKRFLGALEATGSVKEAALAVLNIGSKGGKDINHSARNAGSQMLARVAEETMAEALKAEGVTPRKLAIKTNRLLDDENPMIVDKGITQAAKFGVGDGYAAEKTINTNLNINSSPAEIDKFRALREEYEKKVLEQ